MIDAAFWIGGVLMLAFPIALVNAVRRRSWTRTKAKIVRYEPHPDEDGVARVFRFQTKEGQILELIDPVFANWGHRVGGKVWIIYPPNKPQLARISGSLYSLPLSVGTLGLMIFTFGILGK